MPPLAIAGLPMGGYGDTCAVIFDFGPKTENRKIPEPDSPSSFR
jgi:hypothetical protein